MAFPWKYQPTEPLITPLVNAPSEPDLRLVGGKGFNLIKLINNGYNVPEGFIVTTEAFRFTLIETLNSVSKSEINFALGSIKFPAKFRAEIREALKPFHYDFKRGIGVAVRSSSVGEDSAVASCAGVQRSFLNVRGEEEILNAIRLCWKSLFQEESYLYQGRRVSSDEEEAMAVVVQRMVDAEKAGVLFTKNPINDGKEGLLINGVWGLGEQAVSGGNSDSFWVDRDTLKVKDSVVVRKPVKIVLREEGGTLEKQLHSVRRKLPVLDQSEITELSKTSLKISALFGAEQDIEWAFAEGRLYILQSRPITAASENDGAENGKFSVWSNVNVGEALPGVATPLTWSIIHRFSRMGFEKAFSSLGLSVPDEYELVAGFRGRIYLNLSQFFELASGAPMLDARTLMEVGGGDLLPELDESYEKRSPWRFYLKLPVTLPKIGYSQLLAPFRAKFWRRAFAKKREEFFSKDLSAYDDRELLRLLEEFNGLFNKNGLIMLECASNALSSYVLMRGFLNSVGGAELAKEEQALFTGLNNLSSARPGYFLLDIARAVRENDALEREFCSNSPEKALSVLDKYPEGQKAKSLLDEFVRLYGHRAPKEAEIATPRWREDITFLISVVQTLLNAPHIPTEGEIIEKSSTTRFRATARVRQGLPRKYRKLFEKLLETAQSAARLREDMRANVVDTLSMYRSFFLEIGKRATAREFICEPEDIFYLFYSEVESLLKGEETPSIRLKIASRKEEYRAFSNAPAPPPTFIYKEGKIIPPKRCEAEQTGSQALLNGLPGSPGKVTGRVKIIRSPAEGDKLTPGDILVAPQTDVGWTPLFLVASGLIADLGGPLSHACIVAREYGLPAVVNVRVGTTKLKDGDLVTIDGDKGIVYGKS